MRRLFALVVGAGLVLAALPVRAGNTPPAMPQMAGWFERAVAQFEAEAASDISMAPDVLSALAREWRSFDSTGSAAWVPIDIGWVALATIAALLVERLAAGLAAIRPRRRIARRSEGPHLVDLLGLIAADIGGLAAFYGIFAAAERHLLPAVGVTRVLAMFSANVLIRWRFVAVINRAILRPGDPAARLIDMPIARRAGSPVSVGLHPGDHRAGRLRPLRADGRGQRRAARDRPDRRALVCGIYACHRLPRARARPRR